MAITNSTRFIGLDLAWSARNPSGLAVLDGAGAVLDVRADIVGDDDILHWIRSWLGTPCAIAIDMPTIVRNPSGAREAERELSRVFARYHAAPHPANIGRFPDGGRARALIDRLAVDGVRERYDLTAQECSSRFACEVYPHPAHIRLFDLPHIIRYKKKARPWPLVLSEWRRYRELLASLSDADPPLSLPENFPHDVSIPGYKYWEDALDAICCAYIGSYIWRYGMGLPATRVFGDPDSGAIVVPDHAAIRQQTNGV